MRVSVLSCSLGIVITTKAAESSSSFSRVSPLSRRSCAVERCARRGIPAAAELAGWRTAKLRGSTQRARRVAPLAARSAQEQADWPPGETGPRFCQPANSLAVFLVLWLTAATQCLAFPAATGAPRCRSRSLYARLVVNSLFSISFCSVRLPARRAAAHREPECRDRARSSENERSAVLQHRSLPYAASEPAPLADSEDYDC